MNKGKARYNGEIVEFINVIRSPFTRRLEYLIVYQSEPIWVREDELVNITYYIGA